MAEARRGLRTITIVSTHLLGVLSKKKENPANNKKIRKIEIPKICRKIKVRVPN